VIANRAEAGQLDNKMNWLKKQMCGQSGRSKIMTADECELSPQITGAKKKAETDRSRCGILLSTGRVSSGWALGGREVGAANFSFILCAG
jgi:hypothetical protein